MSVLDGIASALEIAVAVATRRASARDVVAMALGRIVKRDGACVFLGPGEKCGIHSRLGYAAKPGQIEIRGDFRQRIQNEVTLHYPGMGQRQ